MEKSLDLIRVAVGVLVKGNKVLIAKRPYHVHQGGLWEFPGGKINPEEEPKRALKREFKEELGISVSSATQMMTITHHYRDKSVLLDIWLIEQFKGQPKALASQEIKWVRFEDLKEYDFPEANKPILDRLSAFSVT